MRHAAKSPKATQSRSKPPKWCRVQSGTHPRCAPTGSRVERARIGFPVEVRFAAADGCWLSTAYGRDSGYIAVHQYHRREHERYFRAVEDIARSVDGRPHWGKIHYRDAASLADSYPRFGDFVALRDRLDPVRVFGNAYLDRVLDS